RDLVMDLADVAVGAGDKIHDVFLRGVLADVLAVGGSGAAPVLVEQQPHRLALAVEEELVVAVYLQVESDREGTARPVTWLDGELVFEGEAAGERRCGRECGSGRGGEDEAGGQCKCQSSHGSLLSSGPAWPAGIRVRH